MVFFPKELILFIGRINISMTMPMFNPRALSKYLNTSIGFKLIKKLEDRFFYLRVHTEGVRTKGRICVVTRGQ